MRLLDTEICLPPIIPSTAFVCRLLRLIFEEYRWFRPMRYGYADLDGKVDPEHIDYDALGAYYEERRVLYVAARTNSDFIRINPFLPTPVPEYPHAGVVGWTTSVKKADKPQWRAAHLRQVQKIMSWVGSPLAYAAMPEDIDRKERRLVPLPGGIGQERVITVRDYSEGLAGLYWRTFLGPPFLRLFGDRLDTLPAEFRQELSDELVLVQPYELPTQAGTPEGNERERQLISLLGPECFYDHEHHVKPTRRPELGPPRH